MNVLFAVLALALVALAGWLLRGRPRSAPTVMLAVVVLAVAYDDAVIAAGATIGQGDLLFGLSAGRYVLHAALTPLLVVVAAHLLREHDVRYLGVRTAWLTYAILVAVGVAITFAGFELVYGEAMGVVRYSEPDPVPPIPAIVTVILLIWAGVKWRQAGRGSAMLAAAVVMTAVSAMPQPTPPWPSNIGELILLTGIALSLRAPDPAAQTSLITNRNDPARSAT